MGRGYRSRFLVFLCSSGEIMRKFLCPDCRKLVDKFYEGFDEYSEWLVKPKQKDDKVSDVEFVECVEQETVEHVRTFCECGFESKTYRAEDFLVEVDEKNKTIKPIGEYWEYSQDEFEEIAKELGYTPMGVDIL